MFNSLCGAKAAMWTSQRQGWPLLVVHLSNPRGAGYNNLGTGQIMSAALRLHAMCLRLQRACHLQLYSSGAAKYFGYADGSSWDVKAVEDRRNLSHWKNISISVSQAKMAVSGRYVEANLYKRLRNETHPFLRVQLMAVLKSRMPSQSTLGATGTLHSSPEVAKAYYEVDPCYLRYVTQPRFRARILSLPRAPIVMHLRTGYADVDERLQDRIAVNRSATATWMEAACGKAPFGEPKSRVALSDSPGLLRWLSERHSIKSGEAARLVNFSFTRTWGQGRAYFSRPNRMEPEFAAFDDMVIAGYATELQTAAQGVAFSRNTSFGRAVHGTTFTIPALARSMCIKKAVLGLPDCPHYPNIFMRDFRKAILFRDHPPVQCGKREPLCNGVDRWATIYNKASTRNTAEYTRLRAISMIEQHPCKHQPAMATCFLEQVEAMK